jgi:hypothetical protein
MFSSSFISKCIQYKEDIEYLVQQARNPMQPGGLTLMEDLFKPGDAFHHPESMKPSEYKIVKGVMAHTDIYAENPITAYTIRECVILPTEELLKAGLDASSWHLEEGAFGKGAEHLLDAIIESGRFGRKDKDDKQG